jgi:hypothetical protein
MTKPAKKQFGFYADPDIEEFLDTLDAGVKTRTINAALRAWKESRTKIDGPGLYQDKLESLAAWLNGMRPQITVSNKNGEVISLGGLLERFLNQDRQRDPDKSWSQAVADGTTFEAATHRCASCQRSLTSSEVVYTPSRGVLCRQCFEIPFSRTGANLASSDIERYAYDVAYFWIEDHRDKAMDKEYARYQYDLLPKYVQKQIDAAAFHAVAIRCVDRLLKEKAL